jgi:hypothetical protein
MQQMKIGYRRKNLNSLLIGVAALLFFGAASGQSGGDQVLAELGALGANSGGDGVVRPDLAGKQNNDYAPWVTPGEVADGRGFAISPKGTALVLDGNFIREFNVAGTELGAPGIDCTALPFGVPKRNGQINFPVYLSECGAFTPLNDGTLRIAGEAQGGGFVVIKYDPSDETTVLVADGTPPSITDMDGDEFKDSDDRKGVGYWAVGDRKKVIWFPKEPSNPDDFEVVATLNGVRIDAVTPFGFERVIVVLDTGEVLSVNTSTGEATSEAFLDSAADCGLGRKDPQKYSVRGDPSGVLFAGNRGGNSTGDCNAITLFDENLDVIDAASIDSLAANPLVLDTPVPFLVEGLDWQSGQGGDFTVDCDDPFVLEDPNSGCDFGAVEGQGKMFEVKIAEGVDFDTTYRMFQFVDLVDCRHSGDRPCPILNCVEAANAPAGSATFAGNDLCGVEPEDQVLDLTQLLIAADETGVFAELAFGGEDPPVMAIPPYLRGEDKYPGSSGSPVDNGYKFVSFFAVTDAIFLKTFFVDYKIDLFRPGDSLDPCVVPASQSSVADINETANIILYNESDGYDTVDRGGVQGTRGGSIGNAGCNGFASRAKWSANTIGLEFHEDDNDILYVEQVERMAAELQAAKDELLCSPFFDPNYPNGPLLGPLLSDPDCSTLQGNLNQVAQKLGVCIDSLFADQQGDSAENCNAFFTKIDNLRSAAVPLAWPLPAEVANLDLLRPNYEGEFLARIDALEFFVEAYLLNSVPDSGLDPALR